MVKKAFNMQKLLNLSHNRKSKVTIITGVLSAPCVPQTALLQRRSLAADLGL